MVHCIRVTRHSGDGTRPTVKTTLYPSNKIQWRWYKANSEHYTASELQDTAEMVQGHSEHYTASE